MIFFFYSYGLGPFKKKVGAMFIRELHFLITYLIVMLSFSLKTWINKLLY